MHKEPECKMLNNCTHEQTTETCNPECDYYNPIDGSVSPELEEIVEQAIKTKNEKDVNLKLSGLPKFDKKHEFIVMKRHVFEMQNISPKKIILKFKRKLKDTDKIADGCYVLVDKDDKLLIPNKVFAQMEKDARAKEAAKEKEKV